MTEKSHIPVTDGRTGRNYGIDALRMLAMFMVIILHLLGQGGVLTSADFMSGQYKAAWFLEAAAYCAVNCYALISGYVGVNADYKYHNIVMLWLRTVFYTICITLFFSVDMPHAVTLMDWIKAVLPVMGGYYWYFTAYFALFFFIPLLNMAICKMTKAQLQSLVIGLILVFSCLQTLFCRDIFGASSNAWWLMILYIIGGYVRRYGLFRKSGTGKLFLGYILMVTLTWLSKMMIEAGILGFLEPFGGNYMVNNTSPTILAAGIFLLLVFERINTSQVLSQVIRFFSPMAFSVYLIHAHPFIWDHFLTQRFACYADLPVWQEIVFVLLTALAVYVICSLIDRIRMGIFDRLKLKQYLARLEDKYLGRLWY